MSALAGYWRFDGRPDSDRACARILSAQAMYGPHDGAQLDLESISIGRQLFCCLPEDIHDRQPLIGGAGRFALVADLRLDNRDELLADLALSPALARDMADSNVLLAAWERWQDACLDRLCGAFALALFDRGENRLYLARDLTGTRPLVYHCGKDFVAFASMPKGLHALPEIPRAPDELHTAEFLALIPEYGTGTFFKNVERVEPGHVAVVTAQGVIQRRHWNPERRTIRLSGPDDYAQALLHHLDQATLSCLRGAGSAVGSQLSSGMDSSAVTTSAALALTRTGGKVFAFTSVPREAYDGPVPVRRIGDEGPIAAKTAALHPNIEHVLIRTNGRSPLDGLDRNFRLYDRPVLNLCNMTWEDAIFDAARERKLGVLLNGQMGNMTVSFDGTTRLTELIRTGRWLEWLRESRGIIRNGHMRLRGVLAQSFGPYLPSFMWRRVMAAAGRTAGDIGSYSAIRADRIDALDLRAIARAQALDLEYRPRKNGFDARLWTVRRVDHGNYNKGILAGWGIDFRDPTCDRRLLEFCLSVPEEQFLSRGQTKILARRALAGRVAPEVVAVAGKGLQAADWHEGLGHARDALREEVARLREHDVAETTIDVSRLSSLIENWPQGGWDRESVITPYRVALLRGISTGHFLRRASGSNA